MLEYCFQVKTGPADILQKCFCNTSKCLNAASHAQQSVDGDLGALHAQRMIGKCWLTHFTENTLPSVAGENVYHTRDLIV